MNFKRGLLFLAIFWSILIQVLLCLPGDTLPETPGVELPEIDKIAHVILFGAFVGFWCYYFYLSKRSFRSLKNWYFAIYLIAIANGIVMEYVQRYLIADRSFDNGDIIADLIASSIAYGICNVKLLKNRP